ncbi:MAG: transcriptional regulator TrmB [Micrococcales bacterium]|nr:transcriptional regulator TrmB [Micrococcales bacterium]
MSSQPVTSDPHGRDEGAISAYVERLGGVLTEAGMPRLAARVFARLLAEEDGRMTASDLTEALEVSPAAISGAVRYLTRTLMVGKERERGSRRDVYVVEVDAWHAALLSRDRILARLEAGMRSGVAAVGGTSTVAGRRLQLSVEFLEVISAEMARMHDVWERRKTELMADWPDAER